jgi:release factor glutamine methyltransferase
MTEPVSSWGTAVSEVSALLREGGFDQSGRDARALLAHVLEETPERIFAWPENDLSAEQFSQFRSLVTRRLAHEPLSRILGRREFWSLSFRLSADTLDPRPDSEAVIEAVLGNLPDRPRAMRMLDLGTGTGCLMAALLSEYPNATGIAVDVSEGAAGTARQNMIDLGLSDRVEVRTGNWDDGLDEQFDLIVSNPPYIVDHDIPELDIEVTDYDPVLALAGGADGLDAYRRLAMILPLRLAKRGLAILEFGHGQAADIAEIMQAGGTEVFDWKEDLAGRKRCAVCRCITNT